MKKGKLFVTMLCLLVLIPALVFAEGSKESSETESEDVIIRFYYPIGTAGDLANLMNELCAEFNATHEHIIVEPIFAGDYVQTMQRTLTSSKSGNPPDIALLTQADVWTAVDEGIILPLQSFIDSEGEGFLDSFYQGFLDDSKVSGEYYAIPFQKSTMIFYYNMDMFEEAGLDPNHAPETWAELKEYAEKLTIAGERYGVEIPIDQWIMSIYILQNGGKINNEEGNETYLDSEEAIGAMEFMLSLVQEGVAPAKRGFGDSSADFVAGKTAMMYNSTGSMAFVRSSATFNWNAAYVPSNVQKIVETGGGQFVMCKGTSTARQKASWEFIKWMTSAEQTARWSMGSGFVPVKPAAYDYMTEYTDSLPQSLVARDQLEIAVGEMPKTHEARQVSQLMSTTLESILAEKIAPAEGMKALQADVDKILSKYRTN